jgi:RimJ/RimL family protein N-acetyltransferase
LVEVQLIPVSDKNVKEFVEKIYTNINSRFIHPKTVEEIKTKLRKGYGFYFIKSEGKIVGGTSIILKNYLHPNLETLIPLPNSKGLICNTHILDEFQGKGYGPASKKQLEKIAKEKGIKKIFTIVDVPNQNSIKAVLKTGFKKSKIRTKALNLFERLKKLPEKSNVYVKKIK